MKNKLISILLLPLLLTGCLSSNSGTFFETPSVSIRSITPKQLINGKLDFDIGLVISNPNLIPLPISHLDTNISLNNIALLKASSTTTQPIPANGTGMVTLSTGLGIDTVKRLINSLDSKNIDYQMNGNVGVSNLLTLPFSQSGSVDAEEVAKQAISLYLQ